MLNIGNNIYCVKNKLRMGEMSGEATILARQMMEGIFRRDALLTCTFTGQTARAQENKRNDKVKALHMEARTAIISE